MKNKKILMIISIITLISFIIGFSYAYFTTIVIGNDTASSNITTSGSLKLTYNGTDYISLENSQPGSSDSMTFTVTNTGSLPVTAYTVNFSNVINTFYTKSELVYEIDCTSSDAVPCLDKTQTEVPSVSGIVLSQTDIAPNTTHTYTLTVTFTETGSNQNYNQGKELYFKLTINEQHDIPVLTASTGHSDTRYFWDYRYDITSITFEKGIDVPVGAVASWDVSAAQDGSIMSYIIDDGLGTSTYELYFQTESDFILANPDSSWLFYDFDELTTINNLSMLRTYYVTSMYYMFSDCNSLTNLDLSTLNTSNVISMNGMFSYCSNLISLNLSTFDTSNVTDMNDMFSNLPDLTSLDISTFDTNNVTSMHWMFAYCIRLTSLDISAFDTSNVTDMYGMFYYCNKLTSLDLSSFDTSSVTDMSGMFSNCTLITSINLSSFDTSGVTNMNGMFYDCTALTSLDLSTFDTSSVTSMVQMFNNCSSLTSLDLSTFDTSSVTNMSWMFNNCSSLTSLDLRNANFATVTSYSSMFTNITNGINIFVKDATAQTWITSRLTDAGKTGNVTIYV